jgi:2-keto-4-pentenoate hydratase
MNDSTAREAANLLWQRWQAGEVIDALPEYCRPRTRAEGYAVQALLPSVSGRALEGWKIAATSVAGQKHIAVNRPMAGRLLAGRIAADGATVPSAGNRMRVAEPEFAFRFATDLPPREREYSVAEVLAAVATLHPALEIPDSRYRDFTQVGEAQLIADNACAHYFVLGPATSADWRVIDLATHRVHGELHNAGACRLERDGSGEAVLGDPRIALAWLVNELSGLGVTLAAGQVVTTGVCMVPLAILPGDNIRADFGVLGRVSARIAG